MEVSLTARLGGPEVGILFLAGVVHARKRLKAAMGGVSLVGLDAMDITLHIGGSITDISPAEPSVDARYFKQQRRLKIFVSIPSAEAQASPQEDVGRRVTEWLVHGLESVVLPRSAAGMTLGPVLSAFRRDLKTEDVNGLVDLVCKSFRPALLDLFRGGESFYYCTFVMTGEGHAPFLSAWSEEALARAVDKSGEGPEVAADLRWSYADSPYVDFGSEYTEKLRAPFLARPSLQELGVDEWEKEIELRMDAVEQAARQLDAEGAFGAGQRRSRLLVAVESMPPVPSNVDRVARLNDTNSDIFKQWLEEAAEVDG